MQISLRLIPDLVFDKADWEAFCSRFANREEALARLSRPPLIGHLFYPYLFHEEGDALLPIDQEERKLFVLKTHEFGGKLIAGIRRRLVDQELEATGVPLPRGDRKVIPADEWKGLWPNFIRNSAMRPLFGYSDIEIRIRSASQADNFRLEENLVSWLAANHPQPPGKATLQCLAEQHFGNGIPVRIFNLAYARVYKRSRGRPRIDNKKSAKC